MERALTVLELHDEVRRYTTAGFASLPVVIQVFKEFALSVEKCRLKWKQSKEECDELKEKLQKMKKENAELEKKVHTSRKLLDEERAKRQRVVEEKYRLENQLDTVRDLLKDNRINDETKEKLHFLSRDFQNEDTDHLDTITELESTGSVLSELSYTRDEEELNISSPKLRRSRRRRQSAAPACDSVSKRRRGSMTKSSKISTHGSKADKLIAKTTVTVEHSGPISASSVIETRPLNEFLPSAPPLSESESDEAQNRVFGTPTSAPFNMEMLNSRPHHFQSKAMIKGEMCNVCSKRIKFSGLGAKCIDCKTVCHNHCKQGVPLPCVVVGHTPTSKGAMGSIADYTPHVPPMVPALVIHCIKEVEARGLGEVGIYRIPGSDKEVKALKEKFLKGKGVPNLSQVSDIHTICGCLKDFLRSLREPLITQIRWEEFVRASEIPDIEKRRSRLHQIVADLPRPNRDTLVFLLLHLQRVGEASACKMPISNLSKMFGPSIIGYSRNDPQDMIVEANQANRVVAELLMIPCEYWENFIQGTEMKKEEYVPAPEMQKTPSSNSLMNFFSTPGRRPMKKVRYFDSP